MNENVFTYMLMPEEFLRDARMLLVAGSYRSAASRAYYSYYDAVRALLATKDIACKSHQAARMLFGEHFVKDGPFNGQNSKDFHALFVLRQNSDYGPDENPEVTVIEKACATTAEFVLQTEAYLRKNGYEQ